MSHIDFGHVEEGAKCDHILQATPFVKPDESVPWTISCISRSHIGQDRDDIRLGQTGRGWSMDGRGHGWVIFITSHWQVLDMEEGRRRTVGSDVLFEDV